jgi:sec-independent protein translocase protein TatB
MIAIAIVALVVLGPDRLPEMARGAGRMMHKLRTMTEGMQSEVRDVMADPSMQPLKELGELAARPRQKLTEYALEAEAEERAKREAAAAERQRADAADATDATDATDEQTAPDGPSVADGDGAATDGAGGEEDGVAGDGATTDGAGVDPTTDGSIAGDEPVSREPG